MLLRSVQTLAVVCACVVSTKTLAAQESATPRIRFVVLGDGGPYEVIGRLQAVTSDSIGVRFSDADSIARFSRRAITRVERERRRLGPGSSALLGCAGAGAILGVIGYRTSHDPDSPGLLEMEGAALGGLVGCGVGGLVGFVLGSRSPQWEPLILDTLPLPVRAPPHDR